MRVIHIKEIELIYLINCFSLTMVAGNYFSEIFRVSPLPSLLLVTDPPRFTIVMANDAWLKVTDTKEAFLVDKGVFEVFPYKPGVLSPGVLQGLQESLLRAIKTGKPHSMATLKYDLPVSGSPEFCSKYWACENIPVPGDKGSIAFIIHSVTDVTEKILQQEALKVLEEQTLELKRKLQETADDLRSGNDFIETVIQNIPIGLAINKISDGKVTLINKRFCEAYGWREDEMSNIYDFFQKVYPDETYRNEIMERVMADIESGDHSQMSWDGITITTSTGEKKVINAKNIPLSDQDLMISTVIDVTLSARQAAEINLTKANQDALINTTNDLMWSLDNEFKLITANKAFIERLENSAGITLKPGDDLMMADLFPDDFLAFWRESYNKALAGQVSKKEIYTPVFKNGKASWSEVSFNPVYKGDVVVAIACYSRNITERKLAEEANRFKAELLNTIGQAVIATDLDGVINFWNNAATEIYEYTLEEAIGKTVTDLIPAQHTKEKATEIMLLLAQGHSWSGEFTARAKDGRTFPIFVTNAPVYDQHHNLSGIIGVSSDITERKKIEQQLVVNEQQLAVIYNTVTDIVFMLSVEENERFKFISVNNSFLKATGLAASQVLGQYPDDVVPASSWDEVATNYQRAIKSKSTFQWQQTSVYPSGMKTGLVSITPVFDDEGNCVRLVGSVNDITEWKKAEERLKNSEEKYKLLFVSSPVPKWIYDLNTYEIVDVNGSAIEHYGYSREEFLNMTIEDIRPKEDLSRLSNVYKDLETKEGIVRFGVFQHQKRDKTIILVEVSGNRLIYENRDCMMVICNDVTDRELALQKLKDSEAKLLNAQKIAKLGYWHLNIVEQSTYWSDEVYNIWNTSKRSFHPTYQSFLKTIHPDDMENFVKEQAVAFRGERDLDMEHRIILTDGSTKWVHERAKLVRDEHGLPICFEGTVQDITPQKLMALSLEESIKRYSYVTKATFDAIWDWDMVSNKVFWGEGFINLFGEIEDEGATDIEKVHKRIHPDDVDKLFISVSRSLKGRDLNWSYEHRYLKSDGSYAYVSNKALIVRDANGRATRVIGAMRDITDKRTLEVLLDNSSKMAKIGSWEVDLLKGTLYWSNITKEIHESDYDFVPDLETGINFYKEGTDRDSITQKVKAAIENGDPYDLELQIITSKGNEKWVRTIGETEFINGKCIRLYGSFQDIDARKKAELSVIEVFEEKNTILESIGDAFFAVDRNWIVTYWNSKAEKTLGISKNEIIGRQLWEVFADSIGSFSHQKYFQAIKDNEVVHFEDYYHVLNAWFEISAYPSTQGLSVYFKDVTERKLSEMHLKELNVSLQNQARELAVSNAELEQFAYVASHDLQEPLRMVTSFLTQLEKKYASIIDDKGKKYIHFAVDGAKRMRQIILDLLEFSRVGRTEENPEQLDLNELVNEIQILYRKEIEEKNAVIGVEKLPIINAYKVPLRQVFQNLISNALKYNRNDVITNIQITAEEFNDHWQFAVTDNGIGIEKEYFGKIFILFQRLHNKDEFSGTGMGLAITKKIIENSGGKIRVVSEVGKGSTFYFTLPKNK